MFRQIAKKVMDPESLFKVHPYHLVGELEYLWFRVARLDAGLKEDELGHPGFRSNLQSLVTTADGAFQFPPPAFIRCDHLIYAYMVENTRLFEIFKLVLHGFLHGEKFGTPTADSQFWLRATEELFFHSHIPLTIGSVGSEIRSDLRASRRNAYHRMFGMDLNHGSDDGKPYAYVKADAANQEFVPTFEELLREVWVGMTYVRSTTSSNPTDTSKIAELSKKLFDMLRSRRQSGNLSREEFSFVSTMAWFHLTLEFNSPIVKALRAEASGVEQRLFKIAERVGLPAHGLARNFFDIADPISRILTELEMGIYNNPEAVPALYTPFTVDDPDPPSPNIRSPEADMRAIITHWTAITGRDVKARKVASA